MAINKHNRLSHFWEWLGWKSPRIAEHRVAARADRTVAEEKLQSTKERVVRTESMSNWLNKRSEQNHIAEALNRALDHPRRMES